MIKYYWPKIRKQIIYNRGGKSQEIWKNAKTQEAALPVLSVTFKMPQSAEGQLFSVEGRAAQRLCCDFSSFGCCKLEMSNYLGAVYF